MKTKEELYNKSYRILFYDELSEYEQTIFSLKEGLSNDENSNGFNNLGIAYFEIGNYEEAQNALDKSIKTNPKNDVAYVNRAELKKKLGKLEGSESDYNLAIKLNPYNATYWRCRAFLRKENGELINSLKDFKSAAKLEPKFQPTLIEIRELQNKLGIKPMNWIQKLFKK